MLPASYMAKEGVISVPTVSIRDFGKLSLFKHDSLPFMLDGRLVKVKGESTLVVVSSKKDKFVEVLVADLHGCLHVGSVFLCHYLVVKISVSFPCCLCDIFTGKTRYVMRDCELMFLSERFRLDCMKSTLFLFHANFSRSGILSWSLASLVRDTVVDNPEEGSTDQEWTSDFKCGLWTVQDASEGFYVQVANAGDGARDYQWMRKRKTLCFTLCNDLFPFWT